MALAFSLQAKNSTTKTITKRQMKTFEYPPLTESVVLRFTYPCGEDFTPEALRVPAANYECDTHDKSLVTEG